MATNTELKINITVSGADTATQKIKSVGDAVEKTSGSVGGNMTTSFIKGGLAVNAITAAARLAGEAIQWVGQQAMNLAVDGFQFATQLEQTALSFSVLTGSAEIAKKTLGELSDFSLKTPFTFRQLTETSKQLLAYGIEAKDLIPVLDNLGNVAASVGVDKLPQLTLAYGQVKAATRLTGMELRQFTETGIPMLEMLADAYNGVTNSTKMGTKWTKEATKRNGELTKAYTSVVKKMGDLEDKGETGSALWQKYDAQAKSLGGKMKELNDEFGNTGYSIMDMQNKIRIGAISFEDVQKAFALASAEGGRYHDMMILQSKTVQGLASNFIDLKDRFLAAMMGFDMVTGEILKGGLLDTVRQKMADLFQWFMDNEPAIRQAFTDLGTRAADAFNGVVTAVTNFVNNPIVQTLAAFIAGLFPDTVGEQNGITDGIKEIVNQITISTPTIEAYKKLLEDTFGKNAPGQDWGSRVKDNTDLAMEALGRIVVGFAKFAIVVVQSALLVGAALIQAGTEILLLKAKIDQFIWPTQGNADYIESLKTVSSSMTITMDEMSGKISQYALDFNNDWTTAVNNVSGSGTKSATDISNGFTTKMGTEAAKITDSIKNPIIKGTDNVNGIGYNFGFSMGDSTRRGIDASAQGVKNAVQGLLNKIPKGFVVSNVGGGRVAVTTTFAEGGIIPGVSTSGDKVMVGTNSGEMILTREQQGNLFGFLKNLGTQRPNVNVGNVSFGGGERSQMQQENMFMNLLVNAV